MTKAMKRYRVELTLDVELYPNETLRDLHHALADHVMPLLEDDVAGLDWRLRRLTPYQELRDCRIAQEAAIAVWDGKRTEMPEDD